MTDEALRVGVISDTHGLLRPQAVKALRGVDRIVHAGDVGPREILDTLARIAPVTAVRGNVDRDDWCGELPWTAELEVAGRWIHVRHIVEDLDLDPGAAGFDVVVHGHSHRPSVRRRGDVLFLNPGSAGPRRFTLPVTVALLTVGGEGVEASIVDLTDARGPARPI